MPPANGAAPKQQYIRTFASDLKALQESNPNAIPAGTPIPAAAVPAPQEPESKPKPDTKLPAANILAPQAAAIPESVSPEKAPESPELPALDRLIESAPAPELPPSTPPAPEPEPLPPPEPLSVPPPEPMPAPRPAPVIPEPQPAPIQTYSDDFNTRIKEKNASTATILAAEGDTAQKAPTLWKQRPDRATIWYVVGGVAFLVIGVVAALYFYGQYLAKTAPVVLAPTVSAPIFVDDRQQLSGNGSALLSGITQSVGNSLGRTGVRLLYTPESLSGSSTVFSALNLPAPGALTRNVEETAGMAGVIDVNGVQSPFFIVGVTSYADTFAGMLAWEPTMPQDLAALFPPYPVLVATTTATTTAATTTAKAKSKSKPVSKTVPVPPPPPPPAPGFYDDTVASHDVREYRDSQNRVVFLYGYWDQNTLILARDLPSFSEIVNRLATSRAK